METKKRPAPPHAWVKGQSGNPGGRPKSQRELVDRVRCLSDKAVDRLERELDSDDPKIALQAAKEILDRGYGRPVQPVDDARHLSREELEKKAREILAIRTAQAQGSK